MNPARASGAPEPMRIGPEPDTIGRWLDALALMRGIPRREFASLRVELEDHLRERVRELMVAGMKESEASTVAIKEVGDAASFARSYTSAVHSNRRRYSMATAGLVFVAAAGIAVGGFAFSAERGAERGDERWFNQSERSVMPAQSEGTFDDSLLETKISIDVDEMELREVLGFIAASCGKQIDPYKRAFSEDDLTYQVALDFKDAPLRSVLAAINSQLEEQGVQIDARIRDGVIVFAPPTMFDIEERELVAYKIAERLRNPHIELEAITTAIQDFVEPDQWVDNGGEVSRISIVDDVVFIQAPPRVQAQAEWVIDQFLDEEVVGTTINVRPHLHEGHDGGEVRLELVPEFTPIPTKVTLPGTSTGAR